MTYVHINSVIGVAVIQRVVGYWWFLWSHYFCFCSRDCTFWSLQIAISVNSSYGLFPGCVL